MTESQMIKEQRSVILFTRVVPTFKDEVKRVAERDFEGNESRLVRDGVRLMLDLRDELGPRFEVVISELLPTRSERVKP